MKLRKLFINLFLIFIVVTNAQEKILKFDVKIQIENSGILQVVENITIKSEGNIFQRGLVRQLPLTRKDNDGNLIDVEYQINSIQKNGNTENYFTKNENNYWKIYIGNEAIFLENGIYEYQINYSTPFQIGFFDNYDEIYWNVTGNGWNIPIDTVNCQINLPAANDKFENVACYTGLKGSKASDCNSSLNLDKTIASFSAVNLAPNEGLTISTSFNKGIVNPPTKTDEAQSYYKLIKTNLWLVIYCLGMLIFFYFSWKKHGKDPTKETIIAEFRPPFNWSPAVLSYFYNREFTDKSFMTSLINMAVKGAIKINSTLNTGVFTNNTSYEIEIKNRNVTTLSKEEAACFKDLSITDKTIMNSSNYKMFANSYDSWYSSVTSQINLEDFYQNNTQKKWIGFAVFVLSGLLFILLSSNKIDDFQNLFGIIIVNALLVSWFVFTNKYLIIKVIIGFFTFPIALFFFFGSIIFLKWQQIFAIVTIFIAYAIYNKTIGKYSEKGADAFVRAEGFKLYLETAEKDKMNMLNPPELTPQLFEELFPYAIALGVELSWGKQFEKILEAAKYNPEWCHGEDDFYRRPTLFVSSFNDSVLESKTNPSSSSSSDGGSSGSSGSWSSGSSGGGSSGGGGGGGGGGGW